MGSENAARLLSYPLSQYKRVRTHMILVLFPSAGRADSFSFSSIEQI